MNPTPLFRRSRLFGLVATNFLLSCCALAATEEALNVGWRFHRGDVSGAEAAGFDDQAWRRVDLPHDWSVEAPEDATTAEPRDPQTPEGANVGYFRGGVGWYRRSFTLDAADAGQAIEVVFDGVQQDAEVWLNGHRLGFQPHGYIAFHYDLTPHLNPVGQANVLAVRAVNPEANTRWYAGAGIYREVVLRRHGPVAVPLWGARFDTLELNAERAEVQLRLEVQNTGARSAEVSLQLRLMAPDGAAQDVELGKLTVPPATTERVGQKFFVAKPQPWSPESPRLYTAELRVVQAGREVDLMRENFGLRTVSVSAERGFLLNGEPVKLKGGCLHHDNGLLGAAAFPAAEARRVALMKGRGFNAIRTSHNPPSRAFLAACDRLGLLVIDEFTDMWELPKKTNGYNRYFAQHWERDLGAMLARDYNHPSVVIWSIGNEIQERAKPSGLAIGRALVDAVRRVDRLRPVTNAICAFWDNPEWRDQWDPTAPAFALLDIGGYNYMGDKYEGDHAKFPQRVMMGTESYPHDAETYWRLVEKHPYVIGDFVWTGMDHLGESGIGHAVRVTAATEASAPPPWGLMPWPTWINWSGDIDLIGNPKPQSRFRDVVWDRSPIEIAVHAPLAADEHELVSQWGWPDELASWNWPGAEGRNLSVNVYTKAPRVRLELNGRVVGEQAVDRERGITANFSVAYAPGVLRAVALGGDGGAAVGTEELVTTGPAAAIVLSPERGDAGAAAARADRSTVIYVPVEIRDTQGRRVPDAAVPLTAEVTGEAELKAFGTASPTALGALSDPVTESFRGAALVILRPTGSAGKVRVRVTGPGLTAGESEFELAK